MLQRQLQSKNHLQHQSVVLQDVDQLQFQCQVDREELTIGKQAHQEHQHHMVQVLKHYMQQQPGMEDHEVVLDVGGQQEVVLEQYIVILLQVYQHQQQRLRVHHQAVR